jgi:anti-sigma B factor antagonist
MKLESHGSVLRVLGLNELNATNCIAFRDEIRAFLKEEHRQVELDFAGLRFVDSSGLGALVAIHKTLCSRQGFVRILNPTPSVQQILELTRMHRIFEIARS